MPEFGSPFNGNGIDKKLSPEETLRAVRFVLAAELEAVQMYRQIADATQDGRAEKVLRDVANEEVVHAGEFQALADALSPADAKLIADGVDEAKETMGLSSVADKIRGAALAFSVPPKVQDALMTIKEFVRVNGRGALKMVKEHIDEMADVPEGGLQQTPEGE